MVANNGRGYYRGSQTGARSRFGGAAGASARRVLNPWGNAIPQPTGRRANAVGATVARARTGRRPAIALPKADPSVWSINYPKNDPAQWPIEGGKRGPASAMTQAKADVHNAAVNHAFQRTTGLG